MTEKKTTIDADKFSELRKDLPDVANLAAQCLPEGKKCLMLHGYSSTEDHSGPPTSAVIFVFGEDAVEDLNRAWVVLGEYRDQRTARTMMEAVVAENVKLKREFDVLKQSIIDNFAGPVVKEGEK